MPSSPSSRSDENPPRGVSDSSTSFTAPGSLPFHFYPPPQHHPQPGRWDTVSTAPDAVPPYNPAVHTAPTRLTEYPLGPWTVSFPPSGPHPPSSPTQTHTQVQGFDAARGEVYYPTAYNIDTFPFVPHPQPSLHHAYPHAYSQARHQMTPPSPSRPSQTQRRDVYSVLQGNESTASQLPQRHQQRTDPQQSIIHQRTQELLAQANLSSSFSTDHQATAEYGVARGNGGVDMLSGNSESGAGPSSTAQVVGLPFLLGSVDEVLYGVSPSIGEVMGKPNTGAVTGTTSTTHVGEMPNTRISQDPTSASTSALERHSHNLVSEPRVPSTRPPSPAGGFAGCRPLRDMQQPTVTEGGPDSGSGSSLPTHPQSHAESQSSHSHSQSLHINPQSSHVNPQSSHMNPQSSHPHSYIHTHPYIHPRSHNSLSPASYASYPPTGSSIEYSTGSSIEYSTGEYSTTGSSASEYPTATSSVDEYPTTSGYPPGTSLVQQYYPTTSSVGEYPTVQERSASAPGSASVSGSLSRQDGNTAGAIRRYGTGYGHGHSESVSTVTGSSMSSSRPPYEYGEYSMSAAPPTASRKDEHAGGQAHAPNPSRHASASPSSVRPTMLGGVHSQKQRRGRKVHQDPTRRVRGNQPEQGSESYAALKTRPNTSAQGEKIQGQSLGKARALESTSSRTRGGGATRDALTTIGKRARPPKRLRPGSPATAVLARGGDGDSDDDSDDEGDGERPATGPGECGPSGGPEVGGTGGGQGNASGGIGPRKAGACSHCKHLKMKCEFPEGATSCWRCTKSGYACIVEGRKSRNAPNKREYLLAQIRHKDQIIESLLKQLHNPYMATPLSISAFKMATSPSDKDNVKIADWMDRLQSSTKPPSQPCPSRTEMLRELRDSRNNTRGGGNNTMEDSDEVEEGGEATEGEETEKLTSPLPDAAVPIGLLANLSLDKDKGKSKARQGTGTTSTSKKLEDDDNNVGVANKGYFMPGPANNLSIRKNLIEQHSPPDILLHGLVTAADVEKLFEIFWGRINPFISLLDPKIHTPTTIFQRCPFLFTVICAISSRYYDKSEIYPVAMHFAKHAAANALIDGWKSVELCQAYILMSIYIVPARRWEEDRSWLYTGLAIRIATDLNLHQAFEIQPTTERQERELLNRIRVWMICFNLDRSTATQFGKPSTIKEDHITRNGVNWYKESLHNNKYDIHLCGYTTLLRIVSQFHDDVFSDPDSPTGLNRSIDFLTVTLEHDNRLTLFFEEWTKRFNEESDHSDPGSAFRCKLLPFLVNYSRLVMYSFGFQHAFQRGMESNDQVFLQKCFRAATAVIEHMTEVLAPSGFMRSSPDGHFVFASFASAFLLKLLRPEFAQFLTHKMEDEIFELISRLITTLQELAIDERHTPHLYARFLADLLTKHRKGGAGISGHLQSHPPASQSVHKPPTQPRRTEQQYMPSPSSFQYSGLSSQESSHLRYDSDAMQMNTGSFSGTPRSPPPATTPPMPAANAPGPEYLGQPSLPLGVGSTDPADVGMDDILPDMGALASMRALNDVWWSNMMMPGFTWPDAPLMSSLHDGLPSAHQTAFPAFSAPETRVAM